MAGHAVARVGDTISHGGHITSGSSRWSCEGQPIARVGDTATCDEHGAVTITTGSGEHKVGGQATARVTSLCSCGATITSGSARWSVS